MFKLLLLIITFISTEGVDIKKNTLSLRIGWSQSVFGHFGDKNDGFKGNVSFALMYTKDYDDLVSFGFISEETTYFRNNSIVELKLKFFSFTPALFLKTDYLGGGMSYIGTGIYHWTNPASKNYVSTSDDEFGFRGGYIKYLSIIKKVRLGWGFEWNYIIGVKGKNFDLGNINIITPYTIFRYDF